MVMMDSWVLEIIIYISAGQWVSHLRVLPTMKSQTGEPIGNIPVHYCSRRLKSFDSRSSEEEDVWGLIRWKEEGRSQYTLIC